jgi:hypothetical protein
VPRCFRNLGPRHSGEFQTEAVPNELNTLLHMEISLALFPSSVVWAKSRLDVRPPDFKTWQSLGIAAVSSTKPLPGITPTHKCFGSPWGQATSRSQLEKNVV